MFLTFLTFLPLVGAILLTLIPRDEEGAIKQTALAFAVAGFVLSIFLWTNFDSTTHEMQFEYSVPWIPSWGISYHVGLDGISLLLYIMTTFLTMISISNEYAAIALQNWHDSLPSCLSSFYNVPRFW